MLGDYGSCFEEFCEWNVLSLLYIVLHSICKVWWLGYSECTGSSCTLWSLCSSWSQTDLHKIYLYSWFLRREAIRRRMKSIMTAWRADRESMEQQIKACEERRQALRGLWSKKWRPEMPETPCHGLEMYATRHTCNAMKHASIVCFAHVWFMYKNLTYQPIRKSIEKHVAGINPDLLDVMTSSTHWQVITSQYKSMKLQSMEAGCYHGFKYRPMANRYCRVSVSLPGLVF